MASIMTTISDELKGEMEHMAWVKWSDVGKFSIEAKLSRLEVVEHMMKLVENSKFTEKDAEEISEKVKLAMHKRLVDKGLV